MHRDALWIHRETRVRNATLFTSRLKAVALMPTFDLDKKLQPGSSLHFMSMKKLSGISYFLGSHLQMKYDVLTLPKLNLSES